MIRILFFADTHLGFDYPIRPRVDVRRRGPDFYENYQRVLDHARKGHFDLVVHGGDLFFRTRVQERIVDLAYEPLLDFATHGIPIVIVPGNHERSRLPPSLCLGHPNIHVFHEPATFTFDLAGTRVALAGFPFERREIRRRFGEVLERTGHADQRADIRLLCIHQTVEGAQVGPSGYTFRRGRDVIRMDDIPHEFLCVMSGHIHRRQILTRERRDGGKLRVIYPGSTERTSFAESREPKGFFEIALHERPRHGWDVKRLDFVELPARPMAEIELDGTVTRSSLVPYLRSRIADLKANSIVRLRCRESVDADVREQLTSRMLRTIFPPTMNIQVSGRPAGSRDGPSRET